MIEPSASASTSTPTGGETSEPEASESGTESSDTTARLLGGAGILLGAVGVGTAVVGSRRRSAR